MAFDRASLAPTLAVLAVAGAAVAAAFMGPRPDATSAMGAAPPCGKCGVVESVLAARPGDGFRMRIRMDDGTVRTVEQRGALAAGTRVVVEGGSVRLPG